MTSLAAYKNRGHAFHEEIDKKRLTRNKIVFIDFNVLAASNSPDQAKRPCRKSPAGAFSTKREARRTACRSPEVKHPRYATGCAPASCSRHSPLRASGDISMQNAPARISRTGAFQCSRPGLRPTPAKRLTSRRCRPLPRRRRSGRSSCSDTPRQPWHSPA